MTGYIPPSRTPMLAEVAALAEILASKSNVTKLKELSAAEDAAHKAAREANEAIAKLAATEQSIAKRERALGEDRQKLTDEMTDGRAELAGLRRRVDDLTAKVQEERRLLERDRGAFDGHQQQVEKANTAAANDAKIKLGEARRLKAQAEKELQEARAMKAEADGIKRRAAALVG